MHPPPWLAWGTLLLADRLPACTRSISTQLYRLETRCAPKTALRATVQYKRVVGLANLCHRQVRFR